MGPSSKVPKCCFCEQKIAGRHQDGYCKKLIPRLACPPCAQAYAAASANFGKRFGSSLKAAINTAALNHDSRQKLKDNLQYCACSHHSKRHVADSDGNLLACRDCSCDHFWYSVPQTQMSHNLVELIEITAESSVLDKLEALADDVNASPNEPLVAHNRLLALRQKFSLAA